MNTNRVEDIASRLSEKRRINMCLKADPEKVVEMWKEEREELSNCCCDTPIKWGDICTACLEHCEPIDEEN